MVNPGTFRGLRKEFLLGEKATYSEAVTSGYAADALANIQRRYFKRFPPELPLDEDPTAESLANVDDNTPEDDLQLPDKDSCMEEKYKARVQEFEERGKLVALRKAQLKRWFAYQYMKDHNIDSKDSGFDSPYRVLLKRLSGVAVRRPKQNSGTNLWRRGFREEIEQEAIRRLETKRDSNKKKDLASIREAVVKEKFASLEIDEKQQWKDLAKQEHQEALEKWEKDFKEPPKTDPASRQQCIQALPQFIQPILDGICEATGWKCTLIAGGPEPAHNGRLNMIGIHSGTTKGDTKMNFGRAEKLRWGTHIVDVYGDFLCKCYTPEDCRASALRKEDGFERLGELKLEQSGINVNTIDSLPTTRQATPAPAAVAQATRQATPAPAAVAQATSMPHSASQTRATTVLPMDVTTATEAAPIIATQTATATTTAPAPVAQATSMPRSAPQTQSTTVSPADVTTATETAPIIATQTSTATTTHTTASQCLSGDAANPSSAQIPGAGITSPSALPSPPRYTQDPLLPQDEYEPIASSSKLVSEQISPAPSRDTSPQPLANSPPPSRAPSLGVCSSPARLQSPPVEPCNDDARHTPPSQSHAGDTGSSGNERERTSTPTSESSTPAPTTPTKRGRDDVEGDDVIKQPNPKRKARHYSPEAASSGKRRRDEVTAEEPSRDEDSRPRHCSPEPRSPGKRRRDEVTAEETSRDEDSRPRDLRHRPKRQCRESGGTAAPPVSSSSDSRGGPRHTKQARTTKNLRAEADTPNPSPLSTPPTWFTKSFGMFKSAKLGESWDLLLKAWSEFEEQYSYEGGHLPSTGRPNIIAMWIGRRRSVTWRPKEAELQNIETDFSTWWQSLQPEWRVVDGEVDKSLLDGDWDCLRFSGVNGFQSVIAALYFWSTVLKDEQSPARERWLSAVEDCLQVLRHLRPR